MNDEVKMLREVVQSCINLLSRVDHRTVQNPVVIQAKVALNVTSGELPEGYSLDKQDVASGRIHIRYKGEFVRAQNGQPKYTYDPFKARLYCWQQAIEQKEQPS